MQTFNVYDRGGKNFTLSFSLMFLFVILVSNRWNIERYIQPKFPAFLGVYYSAVETVVGILLVMIVAYVMFFHSKRKIIIEEHQITVFKKEELIQTFPSSEIKECLLIKKDTRNRMIKEYHLVLHGTSGTSVSYKVNADEVLLVKQTLESYHYMVKEGSADIMRGVHTK